jgi:hypothetical protein
MMSRMGEQRTPTAPTYADDFYAWTQHQAKLLRALLRLDQSLPDDLDLEHLAEEIEAMGRSEVAQVKGLIRQILVHLIKAASEPDSEAVGHWRAEAAVFHLDIFDHYAPSMRRVLDVQALWRGAMKVAAARLAEHGNSVDSRLPDQCPFTLAELLAEDFSFDEALARLQQSGAP